MLLRTLIAAIGALLLLGSPASATGVLDTLFTVTQDGVGSMTLTGAMLGCSAGSTAGTFDCDGTGQTFVPANPNFDWELSDWNITLDTDPFVSSAFGFKNTGAAATFTIIATLPIIPVGPSSLMGGSTGGSITDSNFDGLGGISTVAGTALFTGMIDGVLVSPTAELHPDPYSLGFIFPGQTVNIPALSFGLPGPTVPGPAAAVSIGIQNKFTLSSGDSISMTNFFVIEPVVPEPSTALLMGLGLTMLGVWRRDRSL